MKKQIIITIMGALCPLISCNLTAINETTKPSIESELDRIYYADPDYYLDVLSSSDELQTYIELSEDKSATSESIRVARKALYERIASDRREVKE